MSNENSDNCITSGIDSHVNKREIHMWWTISLLTIALVGLFAFIYANRIMSSEIIMTYAAFASTLLSIVLSVFAIIYSYFSALEASRHWSDINKAVAEIKNTTEHIENNNDTLLQTVITIKGDVKAIGNANLYNNQNQPNDLKDINFDNKIKPRNGDQDGTGTV